MQKRTENIFEQREINHFNYQKITQPRSANRVIFRHDDTSINKVLVFNTGGYISLSVIPDQSQEDKPSARDRKAMFQNRPPLGKPKSTGLDWVVEAQEKIQKPKEAG